MSSVETSIRPFVPGTTGWSAGDLDDPEIERLWIEGRYEIIDGVLTTMAPAYFTGGEALQRIIIACHLYLRERGRPGSFAGEAEIIIDDARVLKADAALMLPEDRKRQRRAATSAKRRDFLRTRILVPPTLIIESVSPGHELHDRQTKFRWYAEFQVPNYWILDAFKKSLTCWVLEGETYRQDAAGHGSKQVRPSLFPGLTISLGQIWEE
jgi:Uma2 family endonuclease